MATAAHRRALFATAATRHRLPLTAAAADSPPPHHRRAYSDTAAEPELPLSPEPEPPPRPPSPKARRLERRKQLLASTDLRLPHELYPAARAMRRTVHAHVGPTNSGKTHAALEALRSARSGVYCGPLRLLAWEIHDRLNREDVPCTLRTGQEVREAEGAAHSACTIEMCHVGHGVEVST